MNVDNPRPNYRAETRQTPKQDKNTSPTSELPLRQEYPKNAPKNTIFAFFGVFRGVFEGVFRRISHFVCWGDIFACRGLSSVAGRGVLNMNGRNHPVFSFMNVH